MYENDSIYITVDDHIKGSIVIEGKKYSNLNVGHMAIVHNGRRCVCGRKGCFDVYASIPGLIGITKDFMTANKESLMWQLAPDVGAVDAHTAFECARKGDKAGKAALDLYINYLACGLCNLVNIFQPEKIFINGGIRDKGDILLAPLREIVRRTNFYRGDNQTEICYA